MKCLILAAGYATRLYPLTENFPKPLLEIGGKTILDWLVDDLAGIRTAGPTSDDRSTNMAAPVIDEYIVISNHRFAQHFAAWADEKSARDNLHITVVDDGTSTNETRLGAVRDIQFAMDSLDLLNSDGSRDGILVIAGDNVLDFSLTGFVDYARRQQTSCIMRYYEPSVERLHKTGVAVVDDNDLVQFMEEKPADPKSHWCCPPFYFYTYDDAALVGKGIEAGCGTDAPGSYIAWLCGEVPVHAMMMLGSRYDIGNLESYEKVKREYRGIAKQ